MIKSFRGKTAERLFKREAVKGFDRVALRKLVMPDAAVTLDDLRAPPGKAPSNLDPIPVLATFIYKNAATKSSHSALQSQVFSRSPFNAKEYEGVFGDLAGAEGQGGFFKLRYFATAVPYIQGLLLYLLSIGFPFFAVP